MNIRNYKKIINSFIAKMRFKKICCGKSKAFTLVEVTVAMAIFSIVLVIATSIVVSGFKLTGRAKAIKDVEQQSRFSLAEMERKLKFADASPITISPCTPVGDYPCSNPSLQSLEANFSSVGATGVAYSLKFIVTSGQLKEIKTYPMTGLTETRDLTDQNIDITKLSFKEDKGIIFITLETQSWEQKQKGTTISFADKTLLQTKVTLRNVAIGVTTQLSVKAGKWPPDPKVSMTVSTYSISNLNTPISVDSDLNLGSPLWSKKIEVAANNLSEASRTYTFDALLSNADLVAINFVDQCDPSMGPGCWGTCGTPCAGDPNIYVYWVKVHGSTYLASADNTFYNLSGNTIIAKNASNFGKPIINSYLADSVGMYWGGTLYIPIHDNKSTRDLKRIMDMKMIKKALENYAAGHASQFPSTASSPGWWGATNHCWGSPNKGNDGWIPNLVSEGYMDHLPVDLHPASYACGYQTNCNLYLYISNGTDYKVLAHCPEDKTNIGFQNFWDYLRDGQSPAWGGGNELILDKSLFPTWGWSYSIWSSGMKSW